MVPEGAGVVPFSPRSVPMDPDRTVRHLVPVARLTSRVTPTPDVYVVAHMGIARVDVAAWHLVVDGLVERPLVFAYEALTRLPARQVTAVIECYGNPVEPDLPTRRAGNVVWRGVPLVELLRRAGVLGAARAVWLEGLDHGSFAGVDSDCYVKDVPLARALEEDILVAWEMNGAPLTPEHGFPVRAFVPGYFGTNHVKWLSRIHVAASRPESLYTTRLYNRRVVVDGRPVSRPVRELDVHSMIAAPAEDVTLQVGAHEVLGWAWGAWPVRRVEVSTDGGATWAEAQLEPRGPEPAWQRFALAWQVTAPGAHELRCRATDAEGREQPAEGRNRIHTVRVMVI